MPSSQPRAAPKFALKSSLFSVHLNDYIHRPAPTAADARKGYVYGPVLSIQIRHEHLFRSIADVNSLLAKRRKKALASATPAPPPPKKTRSSSSRSKSKTEDEPTTAAAAEIAADATDDLAPDEGLLNMAGEDVVGCAREIVALLHTAQMRVGDVDSKDRKLRTHAIGKRPDGKGWDDVFLITSMHHHLSISKLRVHERYLRFLKTNRVPKTAATEGQEGWEKLELKKTRYWDLMVPTERVEAARAVTAVLRFLTTGESVEPIQVVEETEEELKAARDKLREKKKEKFPKKGVWELQQEAEEAERLKVEAEKAKAEKEAADAAEKAKKETEEPKEASVGGEGKSVEVRA